MSNIKSREGGCKSARQRSAGDGSQISKCDRQDNTYVKLEKRWDNRLAKAPTTWLQAEDLHKIYLASSDPNRKAFSTPSHTINIYSENADGTEVNSSDFVPDEKAFYEHGESKNCSRRGSSKTRSKTPEHMIYRSRSLSPPRTIPAGVRPLPFTRAFSEVNKSANTPLFNLNPSAYQVANIRKTGKVTISRKTESQISAINKKLSTDILETYKDHNDEDDSPVPCEGWRETVQSSSAYSRWKTADERVSVRVYISTPSIKDLVTERNIISLAVFPALRKACAKRNIMLDVIDLSWGIPAAQLESRKELAYTLDYITKNDKGSKVSSISEVLPVFVHITGDAPARLVPSRNIDEKYKDLSGVPMVDVELDNMCGKCGKSSCCLVYYRDGVMVRGVPMKQRKYFVGGEEQVKKRLERLEDIILSGGILRSNYRARFSPIDESNDVVLDDLEIFATQVFKDVWSVIDQTFPVSTSYDSIKRKSWFQLQAEEHELYAIRAQMRSSGFIARISDTIPEIKAALVSGDAPVIVSASQYGAGVTCALAEIIRQRPASFVHFVGASDMSDNIVVLMRRLRHYISGQSIDDEDSVMRDHADTNDDGNKSSDVTTTRPLSCGRLRLGRGNIESLREEFSSILKCAENENMTIVIGSIDNLLLRGTPLSDISWLPKKLPPGVSILASASRKDDSQNEWKSIELPPLSQNDAETMVYSIAKKLEYSFSPEVVIALVDHPTIALPHYFTTAVHELVMSTSDNGDAEAVIDVPAVEILPNNLADLLQCCVKRAEEATNRLLIKALLCFLACSETGLFESELRQLLGNGCCPLPFRVLAAALSALTPAIIVQRGGDSNDNYEWVLSSRASYEFIKSVYLKSGDEEWHVRLAAFFYRRADIRGNQSWICHDKRALKFLPIHLVRSQNYTNLMKTVTSEVFLAQQEIMLSRDHVLVCFDIGCQAPYVFERKILEARSNYLVSGPKWIRQRFSQLAAGGLRNPALKPTATPTSKAKEAECLRLAMSVLLEERRAEQLRKRERELIEREAARLEREKRQRLSIEKDRLIAEAEKERVYNERQEQLANELQIREERARQANAKKEKEMEIKRTLHETRRRLAMEKSAADKQRRLEEEKIMALRIQNEKEEKERAKKQKQLEIEQREHENVLRKEIEMAERDNERRQRLQEIKNRDIDIATRKRAKKAAKEAARLQKEEERLANIEARKIEDLELKEAHKSETLKRMEIEILRKEKEIKERRRKYHDLEKETRIQLIKRKAEERVRREVEKESKFLMKEEREMEMARRKAEDYVQKGIMKREKEMKRVAEMEKRQKEHEALQKLKQELAEERTAKISYRKKQKDEAKKLAEELAIKHAQEKAINAKKALELKKKHDEEGKRLIALRKAEEIEQKMKQNEIRKIEMENKQRGIEEKKIAKQEHEKKLHEAKLEAERKFLLEEKRKKEQSIADGSAPDEEGTGHLNRRRMLARKKKRLEERQRQEALILAQKEKRNCQQDVVAKRLRVKAEEKKKESDDALMKLRLCKEEFTYLAEFHEEEKKQRLEQRRCILEEIQRNHLNKEIEAKRKIKEALKKRKREGIERLLLEKEQQVMAEREANRLNSEQAKIRLRAQQKKLAAEEEQRIRTNTLKLQIEKEVSAKKAENHRKKELEKKERFRRLEREKKERMESMVERDRALKEFRERMLEDDRLLKEKENAILKTYENRMKEITQVAKDNMYVMQADSQRHRDDMLKNARRNELEEDRRRQEDFGALISKREEENMKFQALVKDAEEARQRTAAENKKQQELLLLNMLIEHNLDIPESLSSAAKSKLTTTPASAPVARRRSATSKLKSVNFSHMNTESIIGDPKHDTVRKDNDALKDSDASSDMKCIDIVCNDIIAENDTVVDYDASDIDHVALDDIKDPIKQNDDELLANDDNTVDSLNGGAIQDDELIQSHDNESPPPVDSLNNDIVSPGFNDPTNVDPIQPSDHESIINDDIPVDSLNNDLLQEDNEVSSGINDKTAFETDEFSNIGDEELYVE